MKTKKTNTARPLVPALDEAADLLALLGRPRTPDEVDEVLDARLVEAARAERTAEVLATSAWLEFDDLAERTAEADRRGDTLGRDARARLAALKTEARRLDRLVETVRDASRDLSVRVANLRTARETVRNLVENATRAADLRDQANDEAGGDAERAALLFEIWARRSNDSYAEARARQKALPESVALGDLSERRDELVRRAEALARREEATRAKRDADLLAGVRS